MYFIQISISFMNSLANIWHFLFPVMPKHNKPNQIIVLCLIKVNVIKQTHGDNYLCLIILKSNCAECFDYKLKIELI